MIKLIEFIEFILTVQVSPVENATLSLDSPSPDPSKPVVFLHTTEPSQHVPLIK